MFIFNMSLAVIQNTTSTGMLQHECKTPPDRLASLTAKAETTVL